MNGSPRWPRVRRSFTFLGVAGLALVLGASALFVVALLNGVHCPHCDLGDRYSWWSGYFMVKDVTWAIGGLAGLVSVPIAARRRWGAIAVALALVLLSLTPM